jgi:hypothetical protein
MDANSSNCTFVPGTTAHCANAARTASHSAARVAGELVSFDNAYWIASVLEFCAGKASRS